MRTFADRFRLPLAPVLWGLGIVMAVWLSCLLLHRAAEAALSRLCGLPVTVDSFELSLMPVEVAMRGVRLHDAGSSRHVVVSIGRISGIPDGASLLRGSLRFPDVSVVDIGVGTLSEVEAVAGGGAASGKSLSRAPPDLDAVTDAETQHLVQAVDAFRRDVNLRSDAWQALLESMPAAGSSTADMYDWRDVRRRWSTEWAAIQDAHLRLLRMPADSRDRLLHAWGLDESAWAEEAASLAGDRVQDGLQAALRFRQLLLVAETPLEALGHSFLKVDSLHFSGRLAQGDRVGTLSGAVLNPSATNNGASAPMTVALDATGDGFGHLRLSAVLDHRDREQPRDTLALSWTDLMVDKVRWVSRPGYEVHLGGVRLGLDVSGALTGNEALSVHLREHWTARDVEVSGGDPGRRGVLDALEGFLRATPDVVVNVRMGGTLKDPSTLVTGDVKDALLVLLREAWSAEAIERRASLDAALSMAAKPVLASLDEDLARASALIRELNERFPVPDSSSVPLNP